MSNSFLTAGKLKRLYPRFCGVVNGLAVNFPDELTLDAIPLRSEIWLLKLIEDAYDECNEDCSKNNLVNVRSVKKAVLDLGSMDAFPICVRRLLQRRFSVLEVMQAMMLEFLVTLHHYLDREVKVLHEHLQPFAGTSQSATSPQVIDHVLNGKRITMFAKFLSEEYDLSYVALYLHCRESMQAHFNVRFTSLVTPRIWTDILVEEDLENTNTQTLSLAQAGVTKATPVKLPKLMSLLQDAPVKEVGLPAVDIHTLALLFQAVFVGFSSDTKVYLADRAVETVSKHIFQTKEQHGEFPMSVFFMVQQQMLLPQAQSQGQITNRERQKSRKASRSSKRKQSAADSINSNNRPDTANVEIDLFSNNVIDVNDNDEADNDIDNIDDDNYQLADEFVTSNSFRAVRTSSPSMSLSTAQQQELQLLFSGYQIPARPQQETEEEQEQTQDQEKEQRQEQQSSQKAMIGGVTGRRRLMPTTLEEVINNNPYKLTRKLTVTGANTLANTRSISPTHSRTQQKHTEETPAAPSQYFHVPLHLLLMTIIDEWKKVPTDAKDKFIGRDETTEQLRVLNVIYDKDSLMVKELAESIRLANVELSVCTSNCAKLEKQMRRLERKWADDQATQEDMDELTSVRVAVTEAQVIR
jgi:hypothetical protein